MGIAEDFKLMYETTIKGCPVSVVFDQLYNGEYFNAYALKTRDSQITDKNVKLILDFLNNLGVVTVCEKPPQKVIGGPWYKLNKKGVEMCFEYDDLIDMQHQQTVEEIRGH